MAGEIKALQFAEGTTVAAPTPAALSVGDPVSGTDAVNQNTLDKTDICVASVAALRARTASQRMDRSMATVQATKNDYVYDASSALADDGTNTLKPDDLGGGDPGRWLLRGGAGGGATSTDFEMTAFQDYVIPANEPQNGAGNTGLTNTASTNPQGLELANLEPLFGRKRLYITKIERTGKFDSSGLPEWKVVEPLVDERVKFYGEGWRSRITSEGQFIETDNDNATVDYVIVTGIFKAVYLLTKVKSDSSNTIAYNLDNGGATGNLNANDGVTVYSADWNHYQMLSADALKGLTLDMHTVKYTNSDSTASRQMIVYGFEFVGGDNFLSAGNCFGDKVLTNFSQEASPALTTTNKGANSVLYVKKSDQAKTWATQNVTVLETTNGVGASGGTSLTVTSTAGFQQGDVLEVVEGTSSERIRVSLVVNATTFTTATNLVNTYTAATVKLYCKTFLSAGISHTNDVILNRITPRTLGHGNTSNPDFNGPENPVGTTSSFGRVCLGDNLHFLGAREWSSSTAAPGAATLSESPGIIPYTSTTGQLIFTFYGSGIDWLRFDTASGGADSFKIFIDGVDLGFPNTAGNTNARYEKLVADLPMGTHILRITNVSSATWRPAICEFITYRPKDHSDLDTQQEGNKLLRKLTPATYVCNLTQGISNISTGVIRMYPFRDFIFRTGTGGTTDWSRGNFTFGDNSSPMGYEFSTDRTNATVEGFFYGTGFEYLSTSNNAVGNIEFTVNGSLLTAANFPGVTFRTSAAIASYNTGTAILDPYSASQTVSKFSASGLTLGWHKISIRVTGVKNGSSSDFHIRFVALDIIGGLGHSVKRLQNLATDPHMVYEGSVEDLRIFNPNNTVISQKFRRVKGGVANAPTTTSTSFVLLDDMSITVPSKGGWFNVNFSGVIKENATNTVLAALYLNKVDLTSGYDPLVSYQRSTVLNGYFTEVSINAVLYLPEGIHTIETFWRVNAGTATANGVQRTLTVAEV
jgi:hypothetical protein